jgi:diguanylate cyclase (GGDEF)-like protein
LLATLLIVLLLEVLFIFRPLVRYVQRQRRQLMTLAQTDPLTGCSNRRVFFEIGRKLLYTDQRRQAPSTLLVLDIDHFKRVNDSFGHAAGDAAICHVVQTLLDNLRKSDVLGRIGGEEFAVLLPHTSAPNGVIVAEKVRQAIEQSPLQYESNRIAMTISVGVAEVAPGADDLGEALNFADHAMYRAKRAGRNQVCVSGSERVAPLLPALPAKRPVLVPAASTGS